MLRGALALLFCLAQAPAGAACRQALALGLDVSGSVDAREYRLQLDGLAAALLHPEVARAFLAFPEAPVRLMVYEWAGPGDARTVLDWRTVAGFADLEAMAATLRATRRQPMAQSTALGAAILTGTAALAGQGACARRVLDLSGDGQSNTGPRPREVAAPGIVINGLVIGAAARAYSDIREALVGELKAYYTAEVIRGPGAFVEVAAGFDDFEAAMVRKLVRELTHLVLSEAQ